MPPQSDDKRQAAREVIDILHEISTLLVWGFTSPFFNMAFYTSAELDSHTDCFVGISEHEPRSDRALSLRVFDREWSQSRCPCGEFNLNVVILRRTE
jgi:hypothetical protein